MWLDIFLGISKKRFYHTAEQGSSTGFFDQLPVVFTCEKYVVFE
jgi:hypothetical protein